MAVWCVPSDLLYSWHFYQSERRGGARGPGQRLRGHSGTKVTPIMNALQASCQSMPGPPARPPGLSAPLTALREVAGPFC